MSAKDPTSIPTVYDEDGTLTVLADVVERFVAAWDEAQSPPALEAFLPADRRLRKPALIELIRVDLEYRWQKHDLPKRLRDYAGEFPELAAGGLPADLLCEEFQNRRASGLAVDPQEYLDEYPEQAEQLQPLLDLTETGSEQPACETTAIRMPTGREALAELVAGDRLDDFDLLVMLGEGAFARVFLARQRSMQRLVALKISADQGQEPQTLAQLDHDNIVRVFDQRPMPAQGLRLMYMQYCPGGTLKELVSQLLESDPEARSGAVLIDAMNHALDARGESPLSNPSLAAELQAMTWPEAVCWIGGQLARALDYAHNRGVLHRDLKPANVLLSREGIPKLADFNISYSSNVAGATPAANFGGSLAYMSPEQLEACHPGRPRRPDSLDGRSDQYALGVLLWELLTGARPFAEAPYERGRFATLERMIAARLVGIGAEARGKLPADSPPGLFDVLARCLSPEPDDRWEDCAELARQLDICRNRPVQELLNPAASSRRVRWRRHAVAAIVLAAAIPNVLSGVFNLAYNHDQIVTSLTTSQQAAFWRIQTIINAVAYPVGLGLIAVLAFSVARVARTLERGQPVERNRLRAACRRCLDLGHTSALIGMAEWTLAGLAYPLSLHLAAGQLQSVAYAHFLGSLVLCGLISAAYPFFGVSCIAVRVLYPQLVRRNPGGIDDEHPLERLGQRSWVYLILAVSVPLLATLILAAIGQESRFALLALSGGALLGFVVVYRCFRLLQVDVAALLSVH